MSTVVTKSSPVVVGPATSPATPTVEHIKLSSFDKALAFSPFTSFLVVGVDAGEGDARGRARRPLARPWWG